MRALFLGGEVLFVPLSNSKTIVIKIARMIAHQKIFPHGRFNFRNERIIAALKNCCVETQL